MARCRFELTDAQEVVIGPLLPSKPWGLCAWMIGG
jgi:hypothetical protein